MTRQNPKASSSILRWRSKLMRQNDTTKDSTLNTDNSPIGEGLSRSLLTASPLAYLFPEVVDNQPTTKDNINYG